MEEEGAGKRREAEARREGRRSIDRSQPPLGSEGQGKRGQNVLKGEEIWENKYWGKRRKGGYESGTAMGRERGEPMGRPAEAAAHETKSNGQRPFTAVAGAVFNGSKLTQIEGLWGRPGAWRVRRLTCTLRLSRTSFLHLIGLPCPLCRQHHIQPSSPSTPHPPTGPWMPLDVLGGLWTAARVQSSHAKTAPAPSRRPSCHACGNGLPCV